MPHEEIRNPTPQEVNAFLRKEHRLGKDPEPEPHEVDRGLALLAKGMGEDSELSGSEMSDEVLIAEWKEKGWRYVGRITKIDESSSFKGRKVIGRGTYFLVFEQDGLKGESLHGKYDYE